MYGLSLSGMLVGLPISPTSLINSVVTFDVCKLSSRAVVSVDKFSSVEIVLLILATVVIRKGPCVPSTNV